MNSKRADLFSGAACVALAVLLIMQGELAAGALCLSSGVLGLKLYFTQ